jgi:FkbM family methyltransferase
MTARARFGFSREPEMAALERFVGPDDHSVDIGAHLGIYTWALLQASGPQGRVTAVEPQPELASYLRRAFAREIRGGRVRVEETALGEEPGEATLSMPQEAGRVNRGLASLAKQPEGAVTLTVPVRRLDDLDLTGVRFVKCDVEGFELTVLRGAGTLLSRDHPVLLIEIEEAHAGARAVETFRMLEGLGYDAVVYRRADTRFARIAAGTPDPAAAAAAWVGSYVFNYFFVPSDEVIALDATVLGSPG